MPRIPQSLDPRLPRALHQVWEGEYGRDDLPRLAELLAPDAGPLLRVRLSIALGALGEHRLQGQIEGSLDLVCQRCFGPLAWPLALSLDVVLLDAGTEETAVSDGSEVWILDADRRLWPAQAVEEEVLLALPLAPRHEHCRAGWHNEFTEDTLNPFAALRHWKHH